MSSPPALSSQDRILGLDGFRGLAVLMVTVYRFGEVSFTEDVIGGIASKAFYLGASGVDLFFVLSGFLITGILLDRKEHRAYFSHFYIRRALRIFPLYYGALLLFLFLLPILGLDLAAQGEKKISGNPIHLWLYTTNLSIAWANQWHFGAFDHFWSLAIEEQFYLIWPMIVLFLKPQQLFKACLIGMGIFALCRIGFVYATQLDETAKTFTLFRMDGLLLGSAAVILTRDQAVQFQPTRSQLRWFVCVCCLAFMGTLVLGKNDLAIRYTIVSLAGTAVLLSIIASQKNDWELRLFENRILRSLGKFSYAMYVFQMPLIPLMKDWISPASCTNLMGNAILGALIYVVTMFCLTYAMSVGSWYLFETKFLNLRKRFSS
ncbi:acyltransferase family protein [Pirellulaceae bacterium SH449]